MTAQTDMNSGLIFETPPEFPETVNFRTLRDSDMKRFWDKVDRRGPDECWPWLGTIGSTGYGAFWVRGSYVGAHRISCAMHYGLASGRHALHSCDNRPCCNPRHLRWGSPADNMRDRSERGRAPAGSRHGRTNLTEDDVRVIRQSAEAGQTLASLGRTYDVTKQAIWRIVNRKTWRHV